MIVSLGLGRGNAEPPMTARRLQGHLYDHVYVTRGTLRALRGLATGQIFDLRVSVSSGTGNESLDASMP